MQLCLSPICQAFESPVRQRVIERIHGKPQPLGISPELVSRDTEEGQMKIFHSLLYNVKIPKPTGTRVFKTCYKEVFLGNGNVLPSIYHWENYDEDEVTGSGNWLSQ